MPRGWRPKTTQDSIPIKIPHKGGILEHHKGKFSMSWKFTDINYSVASHDDQMQMFLQFCNLINSLSTDAVTKITINNHHINGDEFRRKLLIKERNDKMNRYRGEYNDMLLDKAESGNGIVQEKYITVSVNKRNIGEARTFFTRVENDLTANFAKLSSSLKAMNNRERFRVFHDFFRSGEETNYNFNEKSTVKNGHSFKDIFAPDLLEYKHDHIRIGDKFARVLFIKDYASYLKDSMVSELTDFSRSLMLSVDILPIPTDEAVKEMQRIILAVESDIVKWQRKQNEQNNFSAILPYDKEAMRNESKEFLDDLTSRDQRMIFVLATLVHQADTLEKLNEDTETIMSIGRKHLCDIATLKWQQEDALNTVLPYGLKSIEVARTMTTESTAVLMPFSSQEIQDEGGIFYGINAVSKNLIVCNRKLLQNGNGFILGVSGSGKSFSAKEEITSIALATDDDILIVDPEREYSPLVKALGGEVVRISADSPHNINALDIMKELADGENPVMLKSEFVMSLCEQLIGSGKMGAKEKSIIDRAVSNVYKGYMAGKFDKPPLLSHFRQELLKQPEIEAKDIALAIELFTDGSLNVFAHHTNVLCCKGCELKHLKNTAVTAFTAQMRNAA